MASVNHLPRSPTSLAEIPRPAAKEYEALANLQVELTDLIGQFGTALVTLEPAWTRAVLHRTHLDDPDFLAHISSTLSLITSALRTKSPMPFYNRPLLATCASDRFCICFFPAYTV